MKRTLSPLLMAILLTLPFGRAAWTQDPRPDPVDRLLDHLQQRDPEQAQRLRELRYEDPQAFRRALRERLEAARQRTEAEDPERLPRDRRRGPEWEENERGRGRRMPPMPPGEPEMRRSDAAIRSLLQQWGQATTDEERATVENALQVAVAVRFDLAEEARRTHLEHLEQSVEQLRQLLEERAEKRDQIILDRVEWLLRRSGDEPPAPPGLERENRRPPPDRADGGRQDDAE